MSIKRNVCVTTLAVTATAAALQANAQQTQSQQESVKPGGLNEQVQHVTHQVRCCYDLLLSPS
ncbi:hypothetical protein, partial [Halomonas sp. Alg239-R46]